MATRSYEVVDKFASPEDFKQYLYLMLAQDQPLELTAKRIDMDELAARRGEEIEKFSLVLEVEELILDRPNLFLGATFVTEQSERRWINIQVTDQVRFNVHD